ncbi:MAG: hypothetical protein AAGF33_16310 [Pseudomonadota bacterium]
MADVPKRHSLSSDGRLSAIISERGAALVGLAWRTEENERQLVLDPDIEEYDRDSDLAYVGAVCGRVCGRIANGRYKCTDGSEIQLELNEGEHHLHGGGAGALSRLNWQVEEKTEDSIRMGVISPAGSEGYPGTFSASITYSLGENRLQVDLYATCDEPCPINLTLHPYFNLCAEKVRPIGHHSLHLNSDKICQLNSMLIPSGEIHSVAGTRDDFQTMQEIGDHGLDTIYCVPRHSTSAILKSPEGDLTLAVTGDHDTLVVYDGAGLPEALRARGGGICLEPQGKPLAFLGTRSEQPAKVPWKMSFEYAVLGPSN